MSETRNIKVLAEDGLLIGNTFVASGKTATVPRERAEALIRNKVAEAAADDAKVTFPDPYAGPSEKTLEAIAKADDAARNAPASELEKFPAYAKLNKGGLTTVDGLKSYITDNPNDWAARLELTEAEAKAVGKSLGGKKTEDKGTTETTEGGSQE